jgi:site-specific DNA-methyltransferase (adenine-specific)
MISVSDFCDNVYVVDCVKGMKDMPDESVDLCITSPPYKDSDGYSPNLMLDSFAEIYRVLKDSSLFFLNFGHLAEDKFRPFDVCDLALSLGFNLNDTITWVKNHYRPIQGKKRLNNLSEFIFILYKGKMPELDRLAIGIPYKDKTNAKRFAGGRDLKCRGNVWYIDYETIQNSDDKLHNDRFPIGLPLSCIKLAGVRPKSLVLDPYMGSFSTAVAAKQLGMYYTGFEKNEDMWEIGMKRIGGL